MCRKGIYEFVNGSLASPFTVECVQVSRVEGGLLVAGINGFVNGALASSFTVK